MSVLQCGFDGVHHLDGAGLAVGREGAVDVGLAEGVAEIAIGSRRRNGASAGRCCSAPASVCAKKSKFSLTIALFRIGRCTGESPASACRPASDRGDAG